MSGLLPQPGRSSIRRIAASTSAKRLHTHNLSATVMRLAIEDSLEGPLERTDRFRIWRGHTMCGLGTLKGWAGLCMRETVAAFGSWWQNEMESIAAPPVDAF